MRRWKLQQAGKLEFERRAHPRQDRAHADRLVSRASLFRAPPTDDDVVAAGAERGMIAVNIVVIRGGGRTWATDVLPAVKRTPLGRDRQGEAKSAHFVAQHWHRACPPPTIVCRTLEDRRGAARALLAQTRSGHPVRHPGASDVWLQMAEENAHASPSPRSSARRHWQRAPAGLLDRRRSACEGTQRLECFDISHTMGEATVASYVVFGQNAMHRPANTAVSTSRP